MRIVWVRKFAGPTLLLVNLFPAFLGSSISLSSHKSRYRLYLTSGLVLCALGFAFQGYRGGC